ncbi:T6SS phospholipase effector Tle1-like catalytic domain-containing protein [Variovorax boronicumulans]|uniref:T6SS phospholipase effector Tle1-like catalytic domain-containing protein n=1 Tax=Variovorax boronicumulans TaxID=436515 RepID=UPI0033981BA6
MAVEAVPQVVLPGERALTNKEKIQRSDATACVDRTEKRTLCDSHVNVGIFFDGTNNNMDRDRPLLGHSNVVVLYDTYKDEPESGYYRFYVPGVGTPFKDIGEETESSDGKSKATGGDARINWALIQLLNSLHRSVLRERLISNEQAKIDATTSPMHRGSASWVTTANLPGKQKYFIASGLLDRLETALKSRPPKKLSLVNVSVFGFSRGAAQARAFCHFLQHALLKRDEGGQGYTLAGVPFRLQFLGLFDSVASVGLANAAPGFRGLGGWANGTQEIVECVERTVHLCAGHEIRTNFPMSTVRIGDKYPSNAVERVYPGAHSNVGGGYQPRDQGKSSRGRASLLSQIPLFDMYNEARASKVPLYSFFELRASKKDDVVADLQIDPECSKLFNAYRVWALSAAGAGTVEKSQQAHMQYYWRWRIQHANAIQKLPSYALANRQDQIDVWESNNDFLSDWRQAEGLASAAAAANVMKFNPNYDPTAGLPAMTQAQRDFLKVLRDFQSKESGKVPPLVDRFFDEMVHDSHGSFYMAGPVTEFDRKEKIKQIHNKLETMRRKMGNATAMQGNHTDFTKDDVVWTLSALERRIYELQKDPASKDAKGEPRGVYPLLTDADREQLLAMEDITTSGAVRFITRKTRRELGGHVCYRDVFSRSTGLDVLIERTMNPVQVTSPAEDALARQKRQWEAESRGFQRTQPVWPR